MKPTTNPNPQPGDATVPGTVPSVDELTKGISATPASEALWLIEQGLQPVRLEPETKVTHVPGWNTPTGRFDCKQGDAPATFAEPCNLGVETGAVSGDLVDVDLDCHEAVAVASTFLPPTEMVWGLNGEPRHYGYRSPHLAS